MAQPDHLTLIRPSATFSRREKGYNPSPTGRGGGVREKMSVNENAMWNKEGLGVVIY